MTNRIETLKTLEKTIFTKSQGKTKRESERVSRLVQIW